MTDISTKYNKVKQEIGFHGSTSEIEEIIRVVMTVAPTDLSVLINGESGTGKEVLARALHTLSQRKKKPMISVNTGAIPEGILESELFGHEKGSFTGAVNQKKGYFEAADTGTIFLDEIGEMSLNTQVKLLRVLEESEIMRVGGTKSFKVDVRLIAATNKNLENAVNNKEFRQDLYYRLKAVTINIPPLRRRKEDIPHLVSLFTEEFSKNQDFVIKGFSPEAIRLLKEYDWPGNVRELRNFIETSFILNRGEVVNTGYIYENLNLISDQIDRGNLPVPLNMPKDHAEREIIYRTLLALKMDINEIKDILLSVVPDQSIKNDIDPTIQHVERMENDAMTEKEVQPATMAGMERELIKQTLKKYNNNRRKTARILKISERTLYRKIKEYGL